MKKTEASQLSEIEKELLTIHYRIHELLERSRLWNNLREKEITIIYKACKKFLRHCKGTLYETKKDRYGNKFTFVLESNLGDEGKQKRKYDDHGQEYLTWVSFGTHHIIREFLPNWAWLNGDNRPEIDKFYKKTLEKLVG